MRILIIHPDISLVDTLSGILKNDLYFVDTSYDGESGLDNALSEIYDAIVLGVNIPKMSGFDVLKQIRANGIINTPVLMLTVRNDIKSRVYCLNNGADYYLSIPFDNSEFLACLNAILRRPAEIKENIYNFGDLQLNCLSCELRCGDQSVQLRCKELEIMRLLMLSGDKTISKESLLVKVWGYNSNAMDNNVEAYISLLRKRLHLLRSKVKIAVARRIGYRLIIHSDCETLSN